MPYPFDPSGPIQSVTASTSAPTAVQVVGVNNQPMYQYMLTNTDQTVDVVVGWGASTIQANVATANGANESNNTYLLARSQVLISGPANAYFTGLTTTNTAVIKVQPGAGI